MELKEYKSMDPNIIYSIVNARLRVHDRNLAAFCEDNGIDLQEFTSYMYEHGFSYHPENNQFR